MALREINTSIFVSEPMSFEIKDRSSDYVSISRAESHDYHVCCRSLHYIRYHKSIRLHNRLFEH